MTETKEKLGINADQTNPGDPEDAKKFSEIVYRRGGQHRGPSGSKYSSKGVKSKEELEYLLENGWYRTLKEAIYGAPESEAEKLERENAKLAEQLDKEESLVNAKKRNEELKKKLAAPKKSVPAQSKKSE